MSEARTAPIVRMAELEIEADQLEAYRLLLAEEIEASVTMEAGVLMLNAVALRDEPNQIRILEVYASQRDYEAHLQTPHFLKYKSLTSGMVKALRLIDVDPLLMRSKMD